MVGEIHQPSPYSQIPLAAHLVWKSASQIKFSLPFVVQKPYNACNIVEFLSAFPSNSTDSWLLHRFSGIHCAQTDYVLDVAPHPQVSLGWLLPQICVHYLQYAWTKCYFYQGIIHSTYQFLLCPIILEFSDPAPAKKQISHHPGAVQQKIPNFPHCCMWFVFHIIIIFPTFDNLYILLPWGESQNNIYQIHDPLIEAVASNQGLYQLICSVYLLTCYPSLKHVQNLY